MDITFDSLVPELETFLKKSGICGAEERKRYGHSLAVMLSALRACGIPREDWKRGMENGEFLKRYLAKDGKRRRTHWNKLRKFLEYSGVFERKVPVHGEGTTLKEACAEYMRHLLRGGYRPRTMEGYGFVLAKFLAFLEKEGVSGIGDLGRKVVCAYQEELFVRQADRHCLNKKVDMLYQVKAFLHWLFASGRTLADAGAHLEMPRRQKQVSRNLFRREEIAALFKAIDTGSLFGVQDRTMFEVLYATGMRISELCSLTLSDADLKAGTLFIREGKGGYDRVVPLPGTTVRYLETYLKDVRPRMAQAVRKYYGRKEGDALFVSREGKHYRKESIGRVLSVYLGKAGIRRKRTCHAFRYSCATHMLENGCDIRYIAELLGHRNLDSTGRYAKASASDLKEAIKSHPREKTVLRPPVFLGKRRGGNASGD